MSIWSAVVSSLCLFVCVSLPCVPPNIVLAFICSAMSDTMIMDAIASHLVLPNRLTVPLVADLHVAQLRSPLPRVTVSIMNGLEKKNGPTQTESVSAASKHIQIQANSIERHGCTLTNILTVFVFLHAHTRESCASTCWRPRT